MEKRKKTGGRQKRADEEKYRPETFTLSPESLAIVDLLKKGSRSQFVDNAIKEKFKRDSRKKNIQN